MPGTGEDTMDIRENLHEEREIIWVFENSMDCICKTVQYKKKKKTVQYKDEQLGH